MLLLVVALALVLLASVVVGLSSGSVRQSILARVSGVVEERAGIRLHARDFRIGLLSGKFEIVDLELTVADAGDAPPFLAISRAHGVVRWRTLLSDVPVIESLSVERPRFDLRAPLPSAGGDPDPGDPDESGSLLTSLEILEFDLGGGEIVGPPVPDSIDVWFDAWRAEEIRIDGQLRSGRALLEELSARWTADSHRRAPVELAVTLSASAEADSGSLTLDALEIRGDGLRLTGRGEYAFSPPAASLVFDVNAEPARLFPDLTSGGRLSGDGELRLDPDPVSTFAGRLRIDAADLPGELADPWVGVDTGGFLETAGTLLDVAVDLDLRIALAKDGGTHSRDRLLGSAELGWRRGGESILDASIRSLESDAGLHLSCAGEVTPAAPGRRRISGELRAPSFAEIADGTLRRVRVELDEPDAGAAAERFGLRPSALPDWWPRGAVTATLEADGPLTAPRMRLDARWDRESGEPLAVLSARTLDDPALRLRYEASFLSEAPGQRMLTGELAAPGWHRLSEGEIRDGRLVLELPDLAAFEEDLARQLPGLLPDVLAPDPIPEDLMRGALSVRAEVSGPVIAPRMRLDARWDRESGEPLAVLSARTLDDPTLRLRYEASFLPAAPGQRELSGELAAPGWHRVTQGEIRDGRLVLELPDLAAFEEDLSRQLPGLLPDGLAPDPVPDDLMHGALSVRAEVSGPVTSPDIDLEADWAPTEGERAQLSIRGRPSARFPFLEPNGEAALSLTNLGLSRFDPAEPASLAGSIDAELNLETSTAGLTANLRLDGRELSYDEYFSIPQLRLEATSDGQTIELGSLWGTLITGTPELPVRGEFSGRGSCDAGWPPRRAEATLAVAHPIEGIDRIETALRLANQILHIDSLEIASSGNIATIRGAMPLGAWTAGPATEPLSLSVSNLDLRTVAELVRKPDEAALPLHGRLDGSLSFDPANPIAAIGSLELSGIAVGAEGEAPLALGQAVRIEMQDGRIVIPPTRLQPTGGLIRGDVPLDLSATVDLAGDWRPGDDLLAAVRNVALDLDGIVDAVLLNRFLGGGSATGEIGVKVTARGAPESLTAEIALRGPKARVIYLRPYPTRFEALEIDLVARQGEVKLERARAKLNGGDAEMTGSASAGEGLHARLIFDGARYRLDFGIVTSLRGDLQLDWPAEGRRRVAGTVVIERAVLRRPINLNREVLGALFDVRPEAGGGLGLDKIDLDLNVLTDQGIMIKNNVADLQADWGRVGISGTAASPLFEGRVDVQPGGILTAFGQALRIDEASFEWNGDPVTEPRMVFDTTSSRDDPSILKNWKNEFYTPADMGPGQGGTLDFWGRGSGGAATGGWEQVAAGAMTQATATARAQLSFEPLPLFGETDTQARYTLSTDLAPQVSFIASSNPRETEAQTYILDIHQLPTFRSFRAQIFTNDQKNEGLTLQQTLMLGKRSGSESTDPYLKSATIVTPDEGPGKRRIRRSLGYRKSDPFPDGAEFDVEVDVIDLMRRRGYPSAGVEVEAESIGDNRVAVVVTVQPGQPVGFVFEGVSLPSKVRKSIASNYRPGELGEQAALEEVQRETSEALVGLGYLAPRVDIEAAPVELANPDGPGVVRVVIDGGRQAELEQIVVKGLTDEDAERVSELFNTTTSRVRLATEAPFADELLIRALEGLGYPRARIAGRELSEDGERLVVRIEPGERRRLASIEIVGLADEDRARLAEALDVRVGQPARRDRIGLAARAIERDLRDRGHADAQVRAQVKPIAEDRPFEVALRYEVDPGPSYRIQEVRFEGLRSSREGWVESVAGLESGQLYRRTELAEARARLFRTGVFRTIRTSAKEPAGEEVAESVHSETVPPGSDGKETVVTFKFEESRRWQLAYGGRWENDRGISVVVDLLNRNSFGVGQMTGVRGIYGGDQQSLRLYHVIPRIVGERSSLELFLEGRQEKFDENFDLKTREAWAQVTFPLTRRLNNRPYIRFQRPVLIQKASDPVEPPDERVISPLIGWQIAFDSLSRRIGEDRRQGTFVGVDLLGSHESLGSDVTLLGVVGQVKYFMPVGRPASGRFTWAQFWRGGLTDARDQDVPFVDRFRLGGEFSVRGYPTNSLGPLDEDGVPLGGEVLFIVNQEIHALLFRTESYGDVSALAFFDAGNVWENRDSIRGGLFKSVGVGARYLSPFGPLRFDFAVPLDRRPDDPAYKLYFGFGSVF